VLKSATHGSSALVVSGAPGQRRCAHTRVAGRDQLGAGSDRRRVAGTCTKPSTSRTHAGRPAHGAKPNPSPPAVTFTALGSIPAGTGGGGSLANPFNGLQLQFYASLVKRINQPPHKLMPIYRAAARRFHVPWQLLAAINRMETDYGTDLRISSAGAVGWMQFMPGTWARYGIAVSRKLKLVRRPPNPYNPRDAIFSAARYLHASGASRSVPNAVFSYNHAGWYVIQVLSIAQQINEHGLRWDSSAHRKTTVMRTTARLLNGMPYVWGGGHGRWGITTGYDCSGFVSAVLHSIGFLRVPVTTQSLPGQRGILTGRGRWVTIYDRTDGGGLNADHVIMRIRRQWWESGGSALSCIGSPTAPSRRPTWSRST
jgi:hypothetical protein